MKKQGFTLVEIMIVVAILGIVTVPFIYLEINSHELVTKDIARSDMTEAGNRSLEWMAKDVREAKSILSKWKGMELGPATLLLEKEECAVGYHYLKDKRRLVRKEYDLASGEQKSITAMANNLQKIEIFPLETNAKIISIKLEFSKEMIATAERFDLQAQVARRIK